MQGFPSFFTKPHFMADCDRCGDIFDPGKGGVCRRCKRVLCSAHMHGSLVQKIRVYFGAEDLCVECRAGVPLEEMEGRPAEIRKAGGRRSEV